MYPAIAASSFKAVFNSLHLPEDKSPGERGSCLPINRHEIGREEVGTLLA